MKQNIGPILTGDNLSIDFGGLNVLTNVSFKVFPNTIYSIIGPNGAGKTSLLNIISGFYKPTSGQLFYLDKDITNSNPSDKANSGFARTFQNLGLFKSMSTLENVLCGRLVHAQAPFFSNIFSTPKAKILEIENRKLVYGILDLLNITAYCHREVSQLSYGIQKRIELARALAMEPRLLLLDEPMAGMNQSEKEELKHYIELVKKQHDMTIILIEHDMNIVMNLSDKVLVLDYGRVIAHGTPLDVQNNSVVIKAYLGENSTSVNGRNCFL